MIVCCSEDWEKYIYIFLNLCHAGSFEIQGGRGHKVCLIQHTSTLKPANL